MQFSGYSMVSRELSSGIRISKKPSALRNVRFSGVKRTCPFALQMSAYDPKRTSGLISIWGDCVPIPQVHEGKVVCMEQSSPLGKGSLFYHRNGFEPR